MPEELSKPNKKQGLLSKLHSCVSDILFVSLQRAALYWIQILIYSRKLSIFAKCVKLLVQTDN